MGPSEPVLSLSFWLPSSPMLAEALSPQTLLSLLLCLLGILSMPGVLSIPWELFQAGLLVSDRWGLGEPLW